MKAILLDTDGAWIAHCRIESAKLTEEPNKLCPAQDQDFKSLPVVCQGFYDSHMHPSWMAKLKTQINCKGKSLGELIQSLKESPLDTVYGFGWDEKSLRATENEIHRELNNVSKHLVLFRICGHVAFVSGQGFLKEKELEKIPRPPLDENAFAEVINQLKTAGIDEWAELLVRKEDHDILLKHNGLLFGNVKDFDYFSKASKKPPYIKYFLDGSLGARTAWLSETYADQDTVGLSQWSDKELYESLEISLNAGFLVAFHCIGDAALDQLLRVSKKLLPLMQRNLRGSFLHRIEHLQVCRDDQIEEIKKQNVWSLGLQPSHRVADADFIVSRLGETRLEKHGYRLKSFIDAGLPISFGSDAPIVSYEIEKNFYAISSDPRSVEKCSVSDTYKIYCVSGRQNAGITAKKLLCNSSVWTSTTHL